MNTLFDLGSFLLTSSASGDATQQGGSMWSMIIMLVVMFVALYFFAIRPQKKRQKEEEKMRNSIDIGDQITTIGGMTGRIIATNDADDEVIFETGSNKSRITLKRWAIQGKVVEETESTKESEDEAAPKSKKADK
jgi:preprotein translocase subunit YajC